MTSFMGKVLRVDLSAGTAESLEIPARVYEAVLAGKGLEAWYLYNNIPAGADPLGPENILAFAAGARCGTGAFLTGRWTVACKSPLISGICNEGGRIAARCARATSSASSSRSRADERFLKNEGSPFSRGALKLSPKCRQLEAQNGNSF